MPKSSKPTARKGQRAASLTRRDPIPTKRGFDPRRLAGPKQQGRPTGGRPPRFPGRTGGR